MIDTQQAPRLVPLEELYPAPWNPRTISDPAFKKLCESIAADPSFLWHRPIVATADGTIYGGNMRYRAVEALGWKEVPAIVEDLPAQLAKERALRDNNQWGSWEDAELSAMLAELRESGSNLDLLGFDTKELDRLLAAADKNADLEDEGEVPEPPAEPISQLGDLWILGDHRLLCGDSSNASDVARLMGSDQAHMVWTDPPYGVSIGDKNKMLNDMQARKGGKGKGGIERNLENDSLSPEALLEMLRAAFGLALEYCRPGGAWYVAAPQGPLHIVFAQALNELGVWHQTIQWVKNTATLAPLGVDYHWRNEPIFYGWTPGGAHAYYGGRKQDTVWEIDRPTKSPDHPTMKPVDLVARAIANSSRQGELVYEPYRGSGTTLIAADQLGRRCNAIELDPRYVDVAVRRWEELTGRTAERQIADE